MDEASDTRPENPSNGHSRISGRGRKPVNEAGNGRLGDQIAAWVAEWGGLWGLADLASQVRVVPGRRLRRSLGRCEPATGTIRLHPQLYVESVELFREVLCHEVAHVAACLLHGRRVQPHGAEWAALMRRAGFVPRAVLDVETLSEAFRDAARPRYVYDHRCLTCGAQRRAGRAVRRWRCRKCHEAGRGGALEITRVSTSPAFTDPAR